MVLLQPELGGVLDRDDALRHRNERAERVEQRRLARSRTTRDQDVEPRDHTAGEQGEHRVRHCTLRHEIGRTQLGAEAADGEHGAVERQRRNDRVDA